MERKEKRKKMPVIYCVIQLSPFLKCIDYSLVLLPKYTSMFIPFARRRCFNVIESIRCLFWVLRVFVKERYKCKSIKSDSFDCSEYSCVILKYFSSFIFIQVPTSKPHLDSKDEYISALWFTYDDLQAFGRLFALIIHRMVPKHEIPYAPTECVAFLKNYIQGNWIWLYIF